MSHLQGRKSSYGAGYVKKIPYVVSKLVPQGQVQTWKHARKEAENKTNVSWTLIVLDSWGTGMVCILLVVNKSHEKPQTDH